MGLTALIAAGSAASGDESVFEDIAAESGLDFHYFNGMSGELYFSEMAGGGVAVFDYDRDGDLDLFFVQGGMLGDKPIEQALDPPRHDPPGAPRLYRNDSAGNDPSSRGFLRFRDVTPVSGLDEKSYGMGVTTGDFDQDGFVDLYVTAFGSNAMLRNRGDGTFVDVTESTGTDDPRWSIPAVFFDADGDGRLDLYVGNYVEFRLATHKPCATQTGALDYCGPSAYPPEPDRLFRNRGDGRFEDVSAASGVGSAPGPSLGAAVGDFDADGDLDLYVSNDGVPNFLWMNRGDGRFDDDAPLAGVAVNMEGQPEASMGTLVEDLDGDGDEDVFLTHLEEETNTLYTNDGRGLFEDRSRQSGLGTASFAFTAFGIGALDYDGDGATDLFVANGEVKLIERELRAGSRYALAQRNQLFRSTGPGTFEEVAADDPLFQRELVSRGVGVGDLDGDGDPDLVVVDSASAAELLWNRRRPSRWLGIDLRDGHGAPRLGDEILVTAGARHHWARVRVDGSYASARDPRVLAGLEGAADPDWVELRLRGGRRLRIQEPPLDRYLNVEVGDP